MTRAAVLRCSDRGARLATGDLRGDRGPADTAARCHRSAVRQELPGVLEHDNAVAQQAPALPRVAAATRAASWAGAPSGGAQGCTDSCFGARPEESRLFYRAGVDVLRRERRLIAAGSDRGVRRHHSAGVVADHVRTGQERQRHDDGAEPADGERDDGAHYRGKGPYDDVAEGGAAA